MLAFFRALTKQNLAVGAHMLAVTMFMAAVADTVYLSPLNASGVPGDARNYVSLAVFLFGIVSCAVFGWKFYTIVKSGGDLTCFGWRAGLSLAFVVLGVYIAGTAVDQWLFFSDEEKAGVTVAQALGVKDIECNQMVLVRLHDKGADYRCPLVFSLGVMTSAPFVPWPSYVAGQSTELKNAIEAASRAAYRSDAPRPQ